MKHASLIGISLALIFNVTFGGETIEKTFSIEPGKLLEVDLNTGGSINVLGWDNNEVKAVVYLEGRDWEDCEFKFDEKPSGLEIVSRFDSPWGSHKCDVDLEVRVPANFDLYLKTTGGSLNIENVTGVLRGKTNGGSLSLGFLKGDINFKTNGGSVDCEGLTGKVDIITNGGSITCVSSEIDGRIHTNGGRISMHNVSGDVDCTTNGGRVIFDNDNTFKPGNKSKVVKIRTKGGDIDVDRAPMGADVKTNGGDISIDSANEFVIAETNGGNIYIDEVNGWIEAHTNGGNVTAKVIGAENGRDRAIEISSLGGEINLILPGDFSATFDITLAYTKNSRREYKIDSDFKVDTRESDEWDYSHGSARKYINGSGEVNGGKNRIEIRTINGNIIIKRG